MGIKEFYPTFNQLAPNAFQSISFSQLAGWKIAVDVSIFLFKYVKTGGDDDVASLSESEFMKKWLDGFISFVNCLKKNGIEPVFVFDGTPPPEKIEEQLERKEGAAKSIKKFEDVSSVYDEILVLKEKSISVVPNEIIEKLRMLFPRRNFSTDLNITESDLKQTIDKLNRQSTPVTREHSAIAKEFIDLMGLAWIQADGEAEGLCAYLAERGDVDAVMSEDTDVFLYKSPYLLSKIDVFNERCCATRLSDILDGAELSFEQFRDMCIMMKVDYNQRCTGRVPGKNKSGPIGPKGALALVKEYGTIENFVHLLDNEGECLKWKRCRELFSLPDTIPNKLVPFSKNIDVVGLENFLRKHYNTPRYLGAIMKFSSAPSFSFE
jgi:flap endonuclease-1